jgi:serine/threonine-protein kinase
MWPNDSYEVEAFIGEGAFAEVYRVRHKFLERRAMKIFKAPGSSSDELAEMLREAVLLSKMNHPNVVRVYEAGMVNLKEDTHGYLTMEYIAGGSLFQYWQSFGGQFMPVPLVIDIMRQVCQGVAAAHSESPPIVHRDLKLQNILIAQQTQGIRARVSDFGLAKSVTPLTQMANSRGTVSFKAPEALQNPQGDSPAADVWALGTILYLLLTGRLPYSAEEMASLVGSEAYHHSAPPPSRWNALCNSQLDAIVLKALKVNPQGRYASALELLYALVNWRPESKRSDRADEQPSADSRPPIGTGQFQPYAPLFALANANLYQTNAFRLTGLRVTATAHDIEPAYQEFVLNKDLRRPWPPISLIPHLVAPGDDEREAAFTRIGDPEQRLLHEFFWFWADDDADSDFAAACSNDLDRTLAVWRHRSSGNDPRGIAAHNLAVFNHLMALQFDGSLLPGQRTASADLWTNAFHDWSAVVGNGRFWDHFVERIKNIDDPRLTPDHAQMIRNSLPEAILYINAQNAVAAAERGDFEEAASQRGLIYSSGLGEHTAEKALDRALTPLLHHLTLLCEQTQSQVDAKPVRGAEVVQALRDAIAPLLRTLICLDDPRRNQAHNEVAHTIRNCLIAYLNQTKAWDVGLPLFQDCLALAEGSALRTKLSADISIIERSLEQQRRVERSQVATASGVEPRGPSQHDGSRASPAGYASMARKAGFVIGRAWKNTPPTRRVLVCLLIAFLSIVLLISQSGNFGLQTSRHAVTAAPATAEPVAAASSDPVTRPAAETALAAPSGKVAFSSMQNSDIQALRIEIAQSEAQLRTLERELQALAPEINDYKTSIDADKTVLDRPERDSGAGTDVDLIRHRHNQNLASYNADIARYNALAREYQTLKAKTKGKIYRYNAAVKSE